MGTIGIYDADMNKYIHVPFNLECMKLAQYYKKKREIVTMSPSFIPERFTTFIYRKDYMDNDFPSELYKLDNIEYGGNAFTNKYQPLDESIEKLTPNKDIYLKYKNIFSTNYEYTQAYKVMYNAAHLRLSLDNTTIWNKYEYQINDLSMTRTLFLHDQNLALVKDSYEVINDLLEEMHNSIPSRYVALKYPIIVNNINDLYKWSKLKPSANYFVIEYQGLINDIDFVNLIRKDDQLGYKRKWQYNITKNLFDENDFIINILPKIYKQIIFSRLYHQRILLKYDKHFFTNPTWYKVIDLLNGYSVSLFNLSRSRYDKIIPDDSLYSFVNSLDENPIIKTYPFTKQDARDAFQLVRESNYNLFKDFYELHQVDLIGGELM